ncbi:MAG: C40 family peptidase [Planctomycetes bacterium]|nr:C40 family peptidase [Planctomycetota bacterium]
MWSVPRDCVRDAYTKGAGVNYPRRPASFWGITIPFIDSWSPPQANELADPNNKIDNLKVIPENEAKPGDIVAFPAVDGSGHSGIYIGNGLMVSASSRLNRVAVTSVAASKSGPQHNRVTYRRYTGGK